MTVHLLTRSKRDIFSHYFIFFYLFYNVTSYCLSFTTDYFINETKKIILYLTITLADYVISYTRE